MKEQSADVVIIGGSMAGSCLARQLKLARPKMKVNVIEKKTGFNHGIGESMLEAFWDYAVRDLGLSKYLDSNYYYKHGLRFFFEKDDRSAELLKMSEMGRTWYHAIPAHQIDRSRFDSDLIAMNSEIGIMTELGVSVVDVELGEGGAPHRVHRSDGRARECRWVVDASGLSGVLSRKFKDVRRLGKHPISAAWMRVTNLRDIDDMGSIAWRQRVNFTNRSLSTNHFMYNGYWIWLIPLDAETCSIGLVWHHEKSSIAIRSRSDLVEFLLSHRWARDLLGQDFKALDFGMMRNMTRIADTIISDKRWFRTGMAAGFIDPLFSSGSAWLTDLNRMIADVIVSDDSGIQKEALERKAAGYDLYAHWWYENFLFHVSGNYHGNYDMHKVLFKALLMDYFGIVLPSSTGEYWRNFANLDETSMEQARTTMFGQMYGGGAAFAHKIKDDVGEILERMNCLDAGNIGNFHDVEIQRDYMTNSFSRGEFLDNIEIEKVRKNIEVEALVEAVKVVALRSNQVVSVDALDDLSLQYLGGHLHSLDQALGRLGL